jgi:hypothetical protein
VIVCPLMTQPGRRACNAAVEAILMCWSSSAPSNRRARGKINLWGTHFGTDSSPLYKAGWITCPRNGDVPNSPPTKRGRLHCQGLERVPKATLGYVFFNIVELGRNKHVDNWLEKSVVPQSLNLCDLRYGRCVQFVCARRRLIASLRARWDEIFRDG